MPRIDLDGLLTHYQQRGAGPDVVLIHAFTSNLAVWMLTNIVETLAADFRVTMYDLRGHGATQVTPSGYRSGELAADFQRLHAALELEPALLVGHSYGGVVAMHAAWQYPARVRGAIVCDAFFPGLRRLEPEMGRTAVWTNLRETILKVGDDIGATVDFSRLFRTVAAWSPEQFETIKQALGAAGARWLSHVSQLAQTSAGEEMFAVDGLTEEAICAVSQPVVALYDEFTPFARTRDFLGANLAGCEVDCVPGAQHLAPVESSGEFVSRVHQHLQRIAAHTAT